MAAGRTASLIVVEDRGAVRVLTMCRPEARNALSPQLLSQLSHELARCDAETGVRAVVLTGGGAVFSAGADISALEGLTGPTYADSLNRHAFDAIRATRKPVVAAVAGYCLGGGCEIAMGCDLVIAGDNAIFGQPEIGLGIIPGAGGTLLWAERCGAGAQALAALSGRMIPVWEARSMGLVERVVPAERVVDAACAVAAEIASRAPLATVAAKRAMRSRWNGTLSASLDMEVALMAGLMESEDAREGLRAFLDKRPAEFRGR